MNRNRQALLLILLMAAAWSPRQLAAQPTPAGPETRVDEGYVYSGCPQIGVAPDRSFEIAWTAGLNLPTDVRARHYGANGSPTDPSDVAVSREYDNEGTDDYTPTTLAVTPVSTGFRVLYEVTDDSGVANPKFFRRRIDPSGVPAPGAPRPVGAPDTQWVLPGPGDALFAGKYDAVLHRMSMRKVDSLGKPAGKVYILNSRPILAQQPTIAALSDGGWIAVFAGPSIAAPGSPARQVIRARRFNAAGDPLGPDFDVNSTPGGLPGRAPFLNRAGLLVAAGPSGRFAVAWDLGSPRSGWSIRMRFFNSAGVPTSPETAVAQESHLESLVSMASDGAGRVLIAWLKSANFRPNYPTFDLRARLILPTGSPVGAPFRVQSAVSKDWDAPVCGSVAWAGDSWLITWVGYYLEEETATFVRRFR